MYDDFFTFVQQAPSVQSFWIKMTQSWINKLMNTPNILVVIIKNRKRGLNGSKGVLNTAQLISNQLLDYYR